MGEREPHLNILGINIRLCCYFHSARHLPACTSLSAGCVRTWTLGSGVAVHRGHDLIWSTRQRHARRLHEIITHEETKRRESMMPIRETFPFRLVLIIFRTAVQFNQYC